MCRVKHCPGIDYVFRTQRLHLQQGFSQNKKVSCLQLPDISKSAARPISIGSTYFSVQPRLNDPTKTMVYVTQTELLNALKMTVLGTSSIFHIWNTSEERFVQSGVEEGNQGFLLMDGKDEVISQR